MMEQVNLLEDPRTAVSFHSFIDDLDRILHVSVDVDTCLN